VQAGAGFGAEPPADTQGAGAGGVGDKAQNPQGRCCPSARRGGVHK